MAIPNDIYRLGGIAGGLGSSQFGQAMTEQEYLRRMMAEDYRHQQMKELEAKAQGAGQKPEKKDDSELLLLLED